MNLRFPLLFAGAVVVTLALTPYHVQAHFIWLSPPEPAQAKADDGQPTDPIEIFFSESPEPGEAELLDRLEGIRVWRVDGPEKTTPLRVVRTDKSLKIEVDGASNELPSALYVAVHQYGVMQREAEPYRLMYVAKAGPPVNAKAWSEPIPNDLVPLDVQMEVENGMVILTALVAGQAAVGCEVKIETPQHEKHELITDEKGQATFNSTSAGRYAIRVRHIDSQAGTLGDKAYASTKTYATLTVDLPAADTTAKIDKRYKLPDLPNTLTSFGAAMIDHDVFIYGGTTGGSHDYYKGVQSGDLLRLPVGSKPDEVAQWEKIAKGPELQGLALVSDEGKLYRIGGFEAKNAQGEEGDLWSTATVECFDLAKQMWHAMPSLPEPRSSFDAAIINHTIYVVGGWSMQGDAPRVWHETAWKLDLKQEKPEWQAIAKQPFERRALAVAAYRGKLYTIGGISSGDDTVTDVEIYDPATNQWTSGPKLVGDDRLTGFGTSAFANGDSLFVTGVTGTLQRLAPESSQWKVVGQLETPRFFHRMLPIASERMLLIGGSNMTGRITKTEVIQLD